MKPIHIILAVISGAIAGATVGLLFAPAKGIKLKRSKMEELADEIADELQAKA